VLDVLSGSRCAQCEEEILLVYALLIDNKPQRLVRQQPARIVTIDEHYRTNKLFRIRPRDQQVALADPVIVIRLILGLQCFRFFRTKFRPSNRTHFENTKLIITRRHFSGLKALPRSDIE